MAKQVFGPKRSRATRKPPLSSPEPIFFNCSDCGAVLIYSGENQKMPQGLTCCDKAMERLKAMEADEASEISLSYQIVGGLNDNAIKAMWTSEKSNSLLWLYLRTFTGGQLKYISDEYKTNTVFALADIDAYAYCAKDPCVECTFRCKRGFALYGYFSGIGLVVRNLDSMSANWRTQNERMSEKQQHNQ